MAYHRTTRRKSYKDKATGEYVEADPIFTESEAGDYLRNNRKAWTIYFDEAETWRSIPPEEFKDLFFRFNDYARDFNRQSFPPEKWYLQSIYDAKCNNLDRDADKYLDTQSLKIKGGRKSAAKRAEVKQRRITVEDAQKTIFYDPDDTLEQACRRNDCSAHDAIHYYLCGNDLPDPTDEMWDEIKTYKDIFLQRTLREIANTLQNAEKSYHQEVKEPAQTGNPSHDARPALANSPKPEFLLSNIKLGKACEQSNMSVKGILSAYAEKHDLWIPRDIVCSQIVEHKDVFDNYTLEEIATYLHNTFSPNRKDKQIDNGMLLAEVSMLKNRFKTICGIIEDFYEMNEYYPDIPDINTIPDDYWDEAEEPKEPDFI